jgi:2,4-dienoyl-CoA reductase-like NADH-dependent reductase (Old Yellow Enzyme family)/thioredoxin reductase
MSTSPSFKNLLSPGRIGTMTVRNKMVMPPMATGLHTEDGFPTERTLGHYAARSEGGMGLIIIEATCIDSPAGRGFRRQLTIDDDKFNSAFSELAEVIHRFGAKTAVQLHHVGCSGTSRITGSQIVGPSDVAFPNGETPRPLEIGEIKRLVERFAQGAKRAEQAGFDGVEIHAAHGYLHSEFLSSFFNRREDAYGGNTENRARFLLETIAAIRSEVGRDFPVWLRIGADVVMEYARLIDEAGVDAIHVSIPAPGPVNRAIPPMGEAAGALIPMAAQVKKVMSVPVIVTSRIYPETAEEAIASGKTDFCSFGRQVLTDPQFANKLASGDLDDIKPCLRCNICLSRISAPEGVTCTVNPALGRDRERAITTAATSKKVTVIGGGPAGMEAARVAALRGHKVTLYEKAANLGGQLLLAEVPPHKQTVNDFLGYLERQMKKLGVDVRLNAAGDAQSIEKDLPDAVVVALGASPFLPDIAGIDGKNVVLAWDVLAGKVEVGEKVAIIGGELVGCEVADMLADAGKQVTLTTLEEKLLTLGNYPQRGALLYGLREEHKATIFTGVQYEEITSEGIVLVDSEGKEQAIPADTVVVAAGTRSNEALVEELKKKVPEVHAVGDCIEPRSLLEAVREGYVAALSI